MSPILKKRSLEKYWNQRYNLFSRYDDGVRLDDEAWWSVTPENIARHISERVHSSIGDGHTLIVDGFCGVGGNLIQFALYSPHARVIGCDINQDRLEMAKHNAKIYGVQHQCEFILGDFMDIMRSLRHRKVDAVFLSPPWGGVGYQEVKKYSLDLMTPNGYDIVQDCRKYITNNIAFLMPRNTDIDEVRDILLDEEHQEFEREENMVGRKVKTITLYFGGLVDQGIGLDGSGDGGASDDGYSNNDQYSL
uniref:Trimethylguanosine synthase n=1 Tax=Aceria tosichella TaxID=561515 RepID=A0A6G1S3W2_9ACAR